MKRKILIVENNRHVAYILPKLLELLGYDSIVATNGKQAVDMATAQLPDLIILDILMSGMNDLEPVRLIRENPKTHSIPILGTTGGASHTDEECFQSGCDDCISNPLMPKHLVPLVEKLLS